MGFIALTSPCLVGVMIVLAYSSPSPAFDRMLIHFHIVVVFESSLFEFVTETRPWPVIMMAQQPRAIP